MIKIGAIIKAKRKEQDLTQEELASRLGVSKATVSKWENNKPNKHYICKEKVWEYNTTDHKYLKQMLLEQVAMGLIEDDD